nr:MBL fold metallo-hydrolase [Anaerolineae bacterium]
MQRGLSSLVVLFEDQRVLVDCGEGTQRQILRSGLGFRRLNKILITHGHLDHILGLAGLISTFARWEATEKIEIWGGKFALDRIEDLIFGVVLRGARPQFEIEFFDIKPGVLMQDKNFVLSAFPVEHRGPDCFGFTFEGKSRRPFLSVQAEELGVPQGPERRLLVSGQPVTLPDGRIIYPDEVLGDPIPGEKLCITGDVSNTDKLVKYVMGADVLVTESTYIDADAELARRYGHLTAKKAGDLAQRAGVRNLLLTHVSRRYKERDIAAEAEAAFPGSYVARDLDHFRVRQGQGAEKIK